MSDAQATAAITAYATVGGGSGLTSPEETSQSIVHLEEGNYRMICEAWGRVAFRASRSLPRGS